MALTVKLGLKVHQLDFVSAYLNGNIEEKIFMEIPNKLQILKNKKVRILSVKKCV